MKQHRMLMLKNPQGENEMTLKATFSQIKEKDASAHDKLLEMIRIMEGETGEPFKRCFERVCIMEPELHNEYLNSNGEF